MARLMAEVDDGHFGQDGLSKRFFGWQVILLPHTTAVWFWAGRLVELVFLRLSPLVSWVPIMPGAPSHFVTCTLVRSK